MPPIHSPRLRIAVLGAGLGSAPHFQSLQDLSAEAELVYVYGRSAERLASVNLPAGAKKTTRIEDILEDASIQAVLVLTPPNTHLELVQRVARAGKHVLVEKPLEIDLNRANALVEACEEAGVTLAVMLQHRLREAAVALRALMAAGELGELVSASAAVRWWRPQSYYDEPGRGTLARDGGGVLITQAIHTLDLLLSFTGMPARVTGIAGTSAVHRMEGEDTAAALLHYGSGAVAVVQATTAAYPGFPERIELNFTRGTATLEGGEMRAAFQDGRTTERGRAARLGRRRRPDGLRPRRAPHGAAGLHPRGAKRRGTGSHRSLRAGRAAGHRSRHGIVTGRQHGAAASGGADPSDVALTTLQSRHGGHVQL
jgi:UDP-N-acetyl-2-amino-2-deoxyglucuronate dehydrogenase